MAVKFYDGKIAAIHKMEPTPQWAEFILDSSHHIQGGFPYAGMDCVIEFEDGSLVWAILDTFKHGADIGEYVRVLWDYERTYVEVDLYPDIKEL